MKKYKYVIIFLTPPKTQDLDNIRILSEGVAVKIVALYPVYVVALETTFKQDDVVKYISPENNYIISEANTAHLDSNFATHLGLEAKAKINNNNVIFINPNDAKSLIDLLANMDFNEASNTSITKEEDYYFGMTNEEIQDAIFEKIKNGVPLTEYEKKILEESTK